MADGDSHREEAKMTATAAILAGGEAARAALVQAVGERQADLPWILAAARDGNADAFAVLVRHHQEGVYHLILRMVRRAAVAEDLAQDVFIRLWRHLGEVESPEMLAHWLRRVAVNAVIDHWRKDEARERRMQVLREHPIARRMVRPSTRMESREALDAVQAALAALPAKLRSVLLLRTSEGLSYEALADLLGISTHAVRSRLFRARQEVHRILRAKMAPEYLARMYRADRFTPAP
jgi:RNA polymerase sigma-70 factor (ECF subfamily)